MSDTSPDVQVVKEYILEEFLPGEDPAKLTPTTPLLASGILDSLAILKVISFIEKTFGIEVAAYEADEENFNTLNAVGALIQAKKLSAVNG